MGIASLGLEELLREEALQSPQREMFATYSSILLVEENSISYELPSLAKHCPKFDSQRASPTTAISRTDRSVNESRRVPTARKPQETHDGECGELAVNDA